MVLPTAMMISVVNGQEALAALTGGADIIDVKNPAEGALGAPSPVIIEDVRLKLKGRKPFSAALGEFPGKPGAAALAAMGGAWFQPDYVKIAFIPHQSPEEIRETLQEIKKSLKLSPKKISLVAVTYADVLKFAAWDLKDFADISREGGADGCLVDTWKKKGKTLLDYLPVEHLGNWIRQCHERQLFCGLAGSLTLRDVSALTAIKPDIIGVRTAVCGGDRLKGTVSASAVKRLKEILEHSGSGQEAEPPARCRSAKDRPAVPDIGR